MDRQAKDHRRSIGVGLSDQQVAAVNFCDRPAYCEAHSKTAVFGCEEWIKYRFS
jgi:hypothetical protein